MKFLGTEAKIFLTFFILFSLFIHWSGYNENSRFALTRAIVDDVSLGINNYYNQTTDRSYFNGNYYSDKEPGISILASVPYAIWKNIYSNLFVNNLENSDKTIDYLTRQIKSETIFEPINPSSFLLTSMISVTLISVLFGSLSVVVLYKVLQYFTGNAYHRLIVTFIYGLGTLIFPSSLVFLDHATVTFFTFLSFFLILKANKDRGHNAHYFLAGILCGLGIVVGMTAVIVGSFLTIYLWFTEKTKIKIFVSGLILGLLPFFVYNFSIFQNPLIHTRTYLDKKIWDLPGYHGLVFPNPFVMLRVLFYPYRGLFFYYPVLLFSMLGLIQMYKAHKLESLIIIGIFLFMVVFNSMWWFWHGGSTFGPRILLPAVPFLVIPMVYVLGKQNKLKFLFSVMIVLSVATNLIGLSMPPEDIISQEEVVEISSDYTSKISSFQVMDNVLFDYYLEGFVKNGPRSQIIDIIFSDNGNSLTREQFYQSNIIIMNFGGQFLSLNINFIILILFSSIILIYWNKEFGLFS